MLGHPKYNRDEKVKFKIIHENREYTLSGYIYIVDAYGTFEQNEEPSYDIMAHAPFEPFNGEEILFKHVREGSVTHE